MQGELQLSLLGKPQVSRDGVAVSGFVSSKVQALLYYLVMTGRPHDRQTLATLLWGEMPEAEARTSLRTALANLRRLVGEHLEISRGEVVFNRNSLYWLDVELFEAALAASGLSESESSAVVLQPLRQALELYRGDFLEGFTVREAIVFEEWRVGQRDRLRQLAVQGLLRLAREHMAREEYAAGIDYTQRLLALEPWREEGHRQLMILLEKSGQRSAAMAQYEICRQAMAEKLEIEPGSETQALYQRLKMIEAPRPHNLPPQTTSFVGREAELARIAGYLEEANCRLLTLVGLGGVGKTRLALQAASLRLQQAGFQDGVFFVPLAAVNILEGVVSSILTALDYPLSGPLEPKRQLLNHLQTKELLLILDNFEHLLPDANLSTPAGEAEMVTMVTDILRAAPQVKLLVTSQERLNLQEEWVLEIEGLTFPELVTMYERHRNEVDLLEPERSSPSLFEEGLEAEIDRYSAVTFFVQQARRVQADFTVTSINQGDIIRLCSLVQGIPLGLELAATWLPIFTCDEITAEIERDLDFLATSVRNMPDRHKSMRAVFESSWNLLSEAEKETLKRLAVFQGGFERKAAIQVAGASLSVLLTLLNRSLLRRDASGRYDMQELVKQFAAEKLAQTPLEKVQTEARHRAYYAEFFQQRDNLLYSPRQLEVLREVKADLQNIEKAWLWAIEKKRHEALEPFIRGLWFFYLLQGRFYEGMEMFELAVKSLEEDDISSDSFKRWIYAHLLARLSDFYYSLTRLEQAREICQKSLALLESFEAPRETSFVLQTLGLIAWNQGSYLQARDYFEESLEPARAGNDPWGAATSVSLLGVIAYVLGDYTEAERLLRQSLPTLRSIDRSWGLTVTLHYLSRTLAILGRHEEARQLAEEGLLMSRELQDRWGIASSLGQLGVVLHQMGGPEKLEAKRLVQQSVALFREVGEAWGLAYGLNQLGQIHRSLGEYEEAEQQLQEALHLAGESRIAPITLDVLVSLVELHLQVNREPSVLKNKETLLELLALVWSHPASERSTQDRATVLLAEFQATTPHQGIKAAWNRGKSRKLGTIVAELTGENRVSAYL